MFERVLEMSGIVEGFESGTDSVARNYFHISVADEQSCQSNVWPRAAHASHLVSDPGYFPVRMSWYEKEASHSNHERSKRYWSPIINGSWFSRHMNLVLILIERLLYCCCRRCWAAPTVRSQV